MKLKDVLFILLIVLLAMVLAYLTHHLAELVFATVIFGVGAIFLWFFVHDSVDDDNEEHDREMARLQGRDDYYGEREIWWER
jgi:hypothetical protein